MKQSVYEFSSVVRESSQTNFDQVLEGQKSMKGLLEILINSTVMGRRNLETELEEKSKENVELNSKLKASESITSFIRELWHYVEESKSRMELKNNDLKDELHKQSEEINQKSTKIEQLEEKLQMLNETKWNY